MLSVHNYSYKTVINKKEFIVNVASTGVTTWHIINKEVKTVPTIEEPIVQEQQIDEPVEEPIVQQQLIIKFDGASKGNPGIGGSAAVCYQPSSSKSVVITLFHGNNIHVTNNYAEYYGLILGLKFALKNGYKNICIQGDSKLVIEQVFGTWKTKNKSLIPINKEAKDIINKINGTVTGKWIPRQQNSEADHYSNVAIETKSSVTIELPTVI
jgi:ribonuclease HI